MAETLLAQPRLTVRRGARVSQFSLQCEPASAVDAGLALPQAMHRLAVTVPWRALRLAPDEWLLIGPADERPPIDEAPDRSLVDVSSRNMHLAIEGDAATDLIRSACPLKLDDFDDGSCARTLFGKSAVILERRADVFTMHYWRSFNGYVIGLMSTAAERL